MVPRTSIAIASFAAVLLPAPFAAQELKTAAFTLQAATVQVEISRVK